MQFFRILFPKSVLVFLLLMITMSKVLAGDKGGEHSGGGSFREFQFKSLGYAVIEILSTSKVIPTKLADLNLKALKNVIDKTRVSSTNDLLHPSPNGEIDLSRTTDAINIPSKNLIRFNIDAWDLIPTGSKRAALVLHEYLGILYGKTSMSMYDDAEYQISRLLEESPGLNLWFNSLELAQSLTENVPFDFAIQCSYRFQGGKTVDIGKIGNGVKMTSINVINAQGKTYEHPKTKNYLQIYIYDESDVFLRGVLGIKDSLKSGIRFIIAETRSMGVVPKNPIFSQSIAIAPNLKFELELPLQKLHFECHRARNIPTKK